MKNTTLGGITGGIGALVAMQLNQSIDGKFSDTVESAIILTVLSAIIFLPPLFIKTTDNRRPFIKENPMIGHLLTQVILVPFGLFSLYVMISNGSINNGFFNLATTVYALGLSIVDLFQMAKHK